MTKPKTVEDTDWKLHSKIQQWSADTFADTDGFIPEAALIKLTHIAQSHTDQRVEEERSTYTWNEKVAKLAKEVGDDIRSQPPKEDK